MTKVFLRFIIFLFPVFLIGSCKKQEAIVPAYIGVSAYDFTIESTEGTGSQKISDVWVYVNDQTIGGFEIPSKIPVVWSGQQVVKIRAGIIINGRTGERAAYPFFDWYTDTIQLIKGDIVNIRPQFKYVPGTKMSLIEEFENVDSLRFSETNTSDTTFTYVTGGEAFEGQKSAEINLTTERVLFEVKSISSFPVPSDRLAFIELNCKANYPFTVGIFANDAVSSIQQQVLTIYPSENGDTEWKKIYVNLTPVLTQFTAATSFNIFIGALRTSDATVNPRILIDNVKLVGI